MMPSKSSLPYISVVTQDSAMAVYGTIVSEAKALNECRKFPPALLRLT
jgi:hypothetical protein